METKDEDGRRQGLELIQQLTDEVSSVKGKKYCGCIIVNCILAREEERFAENGIKCDLRAELPEKLGVSELDLCRILTNMFDNAYSCCSRLTAQEERCVSSNMRVCEGYLYVTVRNTRPSGRLDLKTDKEDKALHGLGLSIIRDIAGRNGGELIIAEEAVAVSVTATLKWEVKLAA